MIDDYPHQATSGEMRALLADGKDPGCAELHREYGPPYSCIESDAVHNACPACLRCTIKAGYRDQQDRYEKVTS